MPTVSKENYLKTIWHLQYEGQSPIAARLAEELAVSPPAVTAALKRMAKEGYVKVGPQGRILLTAKGKRIAVTLVRRHRLVEKLLADVIRMPWYRVHEEAEILEHAISPELERCLVSLFGREGTCPHGYPLSVEAPREDRKGGVKILESAAPGDSLKIIRVHEKDQSFMEYLHRLGLRPGASFRVLERNYGGALVVEIGGRKTTLSREAVTKIWAAPA
ncbi:MAG: metal-dependent transcriptional regulator [Candidatus Tectomicrobia bacterium]|uniref:Transcriptional regulator MntR n=1 Tax=Tectimicrobiota bacterium TaxID=2528274 RepID=A0A932M2A5_UNCTE|nr:metal-dependent transcriptional regulator [Candidatus Tectomicrobia bacterium]